MWLLKEEKTDYLRVDPAETILEVSELELKRMGWVIVVLGLSSGMNLGLRPSY